MAVKNLAKSGVFYLDSAAWMHLDLGPIEKERDTWALVMRILPKPRRNSGARCKLLQFK